MGTMIPGRRMSDWQLSRFAQAATRTTPIHVCLNPPVIALQMPPGWEPIKRRTLEPGERVHMPLYSALRREVIDAHQLAF